jgi:hypothetical protein
MAGDLSGPVCDKRRPAMDFEPGGVFFWDETVFLSRRKHPET